MNKDQEAQYREDCDCHFPSKRAVLKRIENGKMGMFHYFRHAQMLRRCYNEKDKEYKNYGARGIKVCERWMNSVFDFNDDISKGCIEGMSMDRIDGDKGYCPHNVQWSTPSFQAFNQRKSKDSCVRFRDNSYQVSITVDNKRTHIGCFKTKDEAIIARDSAHEKAHGLTQHQKEVKGLKQEIIELKKELDEYKKYFTVKDIEIAHCHGHHEQIEKLRSLVERAKGFMDVEDEDDVNRIQWIKDAEATR